tara:strand:+ start:2966 stop:3166 length:201 start_codon:yes stop_codon:yes gene_type:complete
MAKIDLKFLDESLDGNFLQVKAIENSLIRVSMGYREYDANYVDLDISTSIKFAKAIRTEINKVKGI